MNDQRNPVHLLYPPNRQLLDGEAQRRKMHNLIQELRGNVRVYARVRPFLPADGKKEQVGACRGVCRCVCVDTLDDDLAHNSFDSSCSPHRSTRRST
jgi:hypothetical protein